MGLEVTVEDPEKYVVAGTISNKMAFEQPHSILS